MTTPTRLADLIETTNEQNEGNEELALVLEKALRQIRRHKGNLDATWETAVDNFIVHKHAETREKTLHYYRTQLTVLVRWCEEQGVTLHQFGLKQMDEYLVWRKTNGGRRGKPVADGTLYHDKIAATALFKFCSLRGLIARNPLAGYKIDKPDKVSIPVPTQAELTAIMAAIQERYDPRKNEDVRYLTPPQRRFYAARDYCIIAGLVDTGVREGELLALTLNDLNFDAKEATVRKSKTGQPRTIPISAEWATLLQAWLKVRAKLGLKTDLLFFSHNGEPLSVSYYGKHFQKFVKYAGTKRFTPHALRHFTGTKLAKRSTLAAKDILGHESLKTTQIYAESDREHNREVHEAAAPLAGILGKQAVVRQRKPRII